MESRVHSKFKFQATLTFVLKKAIQKLKFFIFKVIFQLAELAVLVQICFWLENIKLVVEQLQFVKKCSKQLIL